MIPRDPKLFLVGCECFIMQPIDRPPNKVAAEFKGSLGFVKDYNPYTEIATVLIEKRNTTVNITRYCIFPR
jgi:hypothetical protein